MHAYVCMCVDVTVCNIRKYTCMSTHIHIHTRMQHKRTHTQTNTHLRHRLKALYLLVYRQQANHPWEKHNDPFSTTPSDNTNHNQPYTALALTFLLPSFIWYNGPSVVTNIYIHLQYTKIKILAFYKFSTNCIQIWSLPDILHIKLLKYWTVLLTSHPSILLCKVLNFFTVFR